MSLLIGMSGYAQSGKDTVASILVRDYGFTRVAFADRLKTIAYDLNPFIMGGGGGMRRLQAEVDEFGWDRAKQRPEVRRILQALGQSARENLNDHVWIDAALGDGVAPGQHVVVTDVRYPNEAAAIRYRGGFIVRVRRFDVSAVNEHISERAMDDPALWDAVIDNDGSLDALPMRVSSLMDSLNAMASVG